MADKIDYTFAEGEEKGSSAGQQFGYWPGFASSGLTIADGADLSNFTAGDLQEAGVLPEDIVKVSKYLAKPGQPGPRGGQITIKNTPLDILTRDESGGRTGFKIEWDDKSVKNMNEYVKKRYRLSAKQTYEKLNKFGNKFDDLSSAQQTILYDLTVNAGENFIEGPAKDLRTYISNDQWDKVEAELSGTKWDPKDIPRHKRRAGLLAKERIDADKQSMMPDETLIDTLGSIPQ
jgi:hypothetical protein